MIEYLQQLGLSKNESVVYLALCKCRQSTGGNLIKITGFHRNIVYDNLEKLVEKGLVSYISERNRKVFVASPPDSLKDFVEEEQKTVNKKKQVTEVIVKELTPLFGKGTTTHEALILRGIHSLKQELERIFADRLNYVSFGAPEKSNTIMGQHYWRAFSRKQLTKKIKGRLIFNESLREWAKVIKTKEHKIRFLKKEFEPLTQTIVYGDTILIIVWVEKPITTVIRSKEVANNYGTFFEVLWNQAKS